MTDGMSEARRGSAGVNPKQVLGANKVGQSVVPRTVLAEIALGMAEGAIKYGRHNYRALPVLASIYFDAANRHLDAFWEGEDIDPESGISHVSKAISSLVVLRDAMIFGSWTDDRPPALPDGWREQYDAALRKLHEKYPQAVEPYTQIGMAEREACRLPQADETPLTGDRGTTHDTTPPTQPSAREPDATIQKPNGDTCRAYLWADGGQELTLRIKSEADLPPLRHMVEVLSRKKRWADQCVNAISVARHQIHVKRIVDRMITAHCDGLRQLHHCDGLWQSTWVWRQQLRRAALAHDMAEALYGDVPTPQKRLERGMLPGSVEHPHDVLCREFDRAFERAYDTAWMNHAWIKRADSIACCLEAVDRGVTREQLCDWFPVELVDDALDGEWRAELARLTDGPVGAYDTDVWFDEWHKAGGKDS